jgi:nucleoside-diphosphate-sugar epimerase
MPRRTSAPQSHIPLVLVAGGAGFLGSHLCESLLQSGVKVVALDDLVTGSLQHLAATKHHPNFEFIECNINQGLPESLLSMPISHVVHAAAVETHGESQDATLAVVLTGSYGTKNLLDLAVSTGARFLLVSTINIYEGLASSTSLAYYFGSNTEQQAKFSYNEAKRYAEGLCELYAREYNLDVRVARVSQLYGPRMDLRRPELLPRLIRSVLAGEDLKVDADGSSMLLLTFVTDAVYGISRLLFADQAMIKGGIYAFANPEKVSVISISYTLREFLPPGKEVIFLPVDKQSEFALPKFSLDRVKRELDWEPAVASTEGLKQTIASFQQEAPPLDEHVVTAQQLRTVVLNEVAPVVTTESTIQKAPGLKFRGTVATTEVKTDLPLNVAPSVVAVEAPKALKKTHKQSVKAPSWWRKLLFGAVAVLIYGFLGRPMVHTAVLAVVGGLDVQRGVMAAKSLNFNRAGQEFGLAGEHLRQAGATGNDLNWVAGILGQREPWSQVHQGLNGTAMTMDSLVTLSQAAGPLVDQAKQLAQFDKPSTGGNFSLTIQQSQQAVALAKKQLSQAQSVLDKPSSAKVAGAAEQNGQEVSLGLVAGWLNKGAALVRQAVAGVDQMQQILTVLPSALGDTQDKTYLVMLENSNELRPTGGFMGSYALVQMQHGRIATFKVDDIYNPDGQLHSGIAAMAPFAKALGTKELSLLDANWSPDATLAGAQVGSLYTQATGQEVDGVVFVTTQAMREVLRAAGPMKLSGYKETVTADNFDQLAQVYSDVGFTPGSTAKKDFLGEMSHQLLSTLQSGGSGVWLPTAKALSIGLANREIQVWARDSQVLSLLDQQRWSGRLESTDGDYLRVVDANLSSNKSNYYVQRSTAYAINVDRDSALHGVATISWKHSGTSATWPGGDYINYVRLYVPLGSQLASWTGFDQDGMKSSQEAGKTVFGGFVRVPYGSVKSVEVRYDLPVSLSLPTTKGVYQLLWQKQSGIAQEPLKVTFNAPVFLQASQVSSGGNRQGDGVVWQTIETNDVSMRTLLQRQN